MTQIILLAVTALIGVGFGNISLTGDGNKLKKLLSNEIVLSVTIYVVAFVILLGMLVIMTTTTHEAQNTLSFILLFFISLVTTVIVKVRFLNY